MNSIFTIFKLLMMRALVYGILFFTFSSCARGQFEPKNREQLKEYFLYCCIDHGLKNIGIAEVDNSKSTYFDILPYELPALQKVDSLAISFVNSIEVSEYENRKARGIIILSIEEYKSKMLDDFIKKWMCIC